MNTADQPDVDERLAAHLRLVLHRVADTIAADLPRSTEPLPGGPARRRSGRRIAVAIAAVVALAGLGVAWNQLDEGEIVRIPTEAALMSGSAEDEGQWWLIPSAVVHPGIGWSTCDPTPAAVDFVSQASNRPGQEWNTGGVVYGEPSASGDLCHDEAAWLANPARFDMGSTRLGPSDDGGDERTAWGYFATFHPTIARLEVSVDDQPAFTVDTVALPERPDGPRFAAFTTPSDTRVVTYRLLTADGTAVVERTSERGG